MANIEADNELQTAIKALVESYGLTIGKAKAPGVICAVSSLELIYRNYGFHVLDRSLRLCAGTCRIMIPPCRVRFRLPVGVVPGLFLVGFLYGLVLFRFVLFVFGFVFLVSFSVHS